MARKAAAILITAGPTVEDIDPVRFISNRASGKLGFETARAALGRGRRVALIHGPVAEPLIRSLPPHARLKRIAVRSCAQMHAAVRRNLPAAGVVIMSAAVADFTPANVSASKIKKRRARLTLRLKPTVDILAELGRIKRSRRSGLVLIGFALETGSGRARMQSRISEARRKLAAKNLDAIVLDTPAAMGVDFGTFRVLRANGRPVEVFRGTKRAFARRLVRLAEELSNKRSGPR